MSGLQANSEQVWTTQREEGKGEKDDLRKKEREEEEKAIIQVPGFHQPDRMCHSAILYRKAKKTNNNNNNKKTTKAKQNKTKEKPTCPRFKHL